MTGETSMGKTAGLRRWELWGVVVVLLVATALRLGGLRDVPPGLRYDELLDYRMIGRILAGERPLYFAESWGEEPLFLYLQAATLALTKASDWSSDVCSSDLPASRPARWPPRTWRLTCGCSPMARCSCSTPTSSPPCRSLMESARPPSRPWLNCRCW